MVTKNIYIPDEDLEDLIEIGKKMREEDANLTQEKALVAAIQECLKIGKKELMQKYDLDQEQD